MLSAPVASVALDLGSSTETRRTPFERSVAAFAASTRP